MSNNQYQIQYWKQIVELRVHISYLFHYASNSEWWDRALNIFLAVTSSSSIAAWAIWQQYNYVWPTIIAVSQVVTAVKPFLPFKQREKYITDLSDQLRKICLDMENDWYNVAEGNLTEEEIHNLIIQYRGKSMDAEKAHFKGMILPPKPKLLAKAEKDAENYFRSHYDIGE